MKTLSIPSPEQGVWYLGPVPLKAYALCILCGVFVAMLWSRRRYRARGGDPEAIYDLALIGVPAGIIGARLYHVLTDWGAYFGPGQNPWNALKIWNGGLGIWGGVLGGCLAGLVYARWRGLKIWPLLDAVAPTLLVAQAIGRLGNYFNQELYGRPTDLPWGLEISPAHRMAGFANFATFHPTFLYELVWNLAMAGLIVFLERRFRLWGGQVFALYVMLYTLGRAWIESLRIDTSYHVWGLRLNLWTSLIVYVLALVAFVYLGRKHFSPRVEGNASVKPDSATELAREVRGDDGRERSLAEGNEALRATFLAEVSEHVVETKEEEENASSPSPAEVENVSAPEQNREALESAASPSALEAVKENSSASLSASALSDRDLSGQLEEPVLPLPPVRRNRDRGALEE